MSLCFPTSFPALLRNSFLMQFHAVNTHASALAQTVAKTKTKTNTRPIPIPESTATGYDERDASPRLRSRSRLRHCGRKHCGSGSGCDCGRRRQPSGSCRMLKEWYTLPVHVSPRWALELFGLVFACASCGFSCDFAWLGSFLPRCFSTHSSQKRPRDVQFQKFERFICARARPLREVYLVKKKAKQKFKEETQHNKR